MVTRATQAGVALCITASNTKTTHNIIVICLVYLNLLKFKNQHKEDVAT
jgi:hypothetical protein